MLATMNRRAVYRLLDRTLIGVLFLLALILIGVTAARAGEIIPMVGMTRPVDGDDQSQISGGLALRGNLLPIIKTEIAASYRSDKFFNGDLEVRQWPVTASLY